MTPVGWPIERTVILTLDFECDFGTALPENRYEAVTEVGRLVSLLEEYEIPLTCFVQTALFEERPDAVETLREADTTVSFHPHSHTHKPRKETEHADPAPDVDDAHIRTSPGRKPRSRGNSKGVPRASRTSLGKRPWAIAFRTGTSARRIIGC